jgi:hypothetical protein
MQITCEYCSHTFTIQRTLKQHYERCKEKKLAEQKKLYEEQLQNHRKTYLNQLEQQQEEHKTQLQKQQEQYEIKIQLLDQKINEQREQIEKLESQNLEFHNQIFEIAKQPKQIHNNNNSNNTNTTHNNQKTLNIVNQLATYDLTVEMVQEILDKYTLEKVFRDGPNSIADFVVEKILTDTVTQKPKLIATDRSRGVFKYKDTEGNVHVDNKLTKTADILQKPLFKANDQVLLEIFKRHNYDIDDFTRNTFSENTELLNSINKEKLSAKLSRRLQSQFTDVSTDVWALNDENDFENDKP